MRSRRRRWLREEILAPWLTMSVILGMWWLGASVIARDAPLSGMLSRDRRAESAANRESPPTVRTVAPSAPAPNAATAVGAVSATDGSSVSYGEDVAALLEKDLLLPVAGVDTSALRSSFIESRGGGTRTHEAIDILAPRGTAVYATQDGRIAKLFTSAAGGLTIYQFDSDEEYCFYYAHLDAYAPSLADGQTVRRGQTIGYVGTTGNAPESTPHLHFAIFKLGAEKRWWEGEPLDPFLVLRRHG
jgi:peptidoglycan LD-endopeptidase LytH